jgi:hypothetical protein
VGGTEHWDGEGLYGRSAPLVLLINQKQFGLREVAGLYNVLRELEPMDLAVKIVLQAQTKPLSSSSGSQRILT